LLARVRLIPRADLVTWDAALVSTSRIWVLLGRRVAVLWGLGFDLPPSILCGDV
jgi:hypothetical protein